MSHKIVELFYPGDDDFNIKGDESKKVLDPNQDYNNEAERKNVFTKKVTKYVSKKTAIVKDGDF